MKPTPAALRRVALTSLLCAVAVAQWVRGLGGWVALLVGVCIGIDSAQLAQGVAKARGETER
jgi:hypothetical protein